MRSLPVVLVLALTGCGAAGRDAPREWRSGADDACFRVRSVLSPLQPPSSFRTAELVAGAVALAVRDELDRTQRLGEPPPALRRAAARLRDARRAMLAELVGEIRAARRRDLPGVQRAIRRLTGLSHAATRAAAAAGLRVCGHELDRNLTQLPA